MSRRNYNNNDAIRWSTNWLRWEERWWCDGKKTKEMPNVKKKSHDLLRSFTAITSFAAAARCCRWDEKRHFFWEKQKRS